MLWTIDIELNEVFFSISNFQINASRRASITSHQSDRLRVRPTCVFSPLLKPDHLYVTCFVFLHLVFTWWLTSIWITAGFFSFILLSSCVKLSSDLCTAQHNTDMIWLLCWYLHPFSNRKEIHSCPQRERESRVFPGDKWKLFQSDGLV